MNPSTKHNITSYIAQASMMANNSYTLHISYKTIQHRGRKSTTLGFTKVSTHIFKIKNKSKKQPQVQNITLKNQLQAQHQGLLEIKYT